MLLTGPGTAVGQGGDSALAEIPIDHGDTVGVLTSAVASSLPLLARHVSFAPGEARVALIVPQVRDAALDTLARRTGTEPLRGELVRCDDERPTECRFRNEFEFAVRVEKLGVEPERQVARVTVSLMQEGGGPGGGTFVVTYESRLERAVRGVWTVVSSRVTGIT